MPGAGAGCRLGGLDRAHVAGGQARAPSRRPEAARGRPGPRRAAGAAPCRGAARCHRRTTRRRHRRARSMPVAPLGRCGIGRASWSARTSSTSTPGARGCQLVAGRVGRHRGAGGRATAGWRGAVTTGTWPSRRSEGRSAWSWCRWLSSTASTSSTWCCTGRSRRRRSMPEPAAQQGVGEDAQRRRARAAPSSGRARWRARRRVPWSCPQPAAVPRPHASRGTMGAPCPPPTADRPATAPVLPPLHIGRHVVESPVVLAPMAGITNRAFRRLCREYGTAGLAGRWRLRGDQPLRVRDGDDPGARRAHPGDDAAHLARPRRGPPLGAAVLRRPGDRRAWPPASSSPRTAPTTSTSTSAARCPR